MSSTPVSFASESVLLLVDFQQGFDEPGWGTRNNPNTEERAATLLSAWRRADWPVAHVRHDSTDPSSPLRKGTAGFAFKPEAVPEDDEQTFVKSVNSAFIGTGLEAWLHDHDYNTVVIAGLTTDHCVSTSARMAENLGFTVVVGSDVTATFDRSFDGDLFAADLIHRTALAQLNREFATVVPTDVIRRALP